MKPAIQIKQFSGHLFWDTPRPGLDIDKHKSYIIKQVLEYGLIKDWRLIQKYYGIDRIAEVAQSFRELDKKALSFISHLSKVPQETFRCYNFQQSIPPHWNF